MSIREKLTQYSLIISIVTGGIAIVGATWASGFRPAIAFELEELREEFEADKLLRLKKEWYTAKDKEEAYKRRSEPVPKWLIDKIVSLETQIRKLEKKG
jgi:hypothetical protein